MTLLTNEWTNAVSLLREPRFIILFLLPADFPKRRFRIQKRRSLMLKEYLQTVPSPQSCRTEVMPGVTVWRFDLPSPQTAKLLSLPLSPSPLHFETLFCQRGRLLAELSGNRLITAEKHEILLLSDTSHLRSFRISENLKGILVAVDAAAARESLLSVCSALGLRLDTGMVKKRMAGLDGCASLGGIPWSQAVFEYLENLSGDSGEQYCVLKAIELLYLFCTDRDLFHQKAPVCPGGYVSRCVSQACSYMEEHLSEKITIHDLCLLFSLSPTSLKTGFRLIHGTTPHRWLTEQRMKRALDLLQTTQMTIQEISQTVGYDSVSQFSAVFKQYCGMTPGQFTKMSKTGRTCPFQ